MKTDIKDFADIKLMVDSFYEQVRKDALIGPIFNEVIKDNWGPHLEKMYAFWSAVLLNIKGYSGSPFPPHLALGLGKEHFERWLCLFKQNLESKLQGPVSRDALNRAQNMARMFQYKINYYQGRRPIS